MKQAMVVGGAGFIGTHLLEHLGREGGFDRLVSVDIAAPRRPVPGVAYEVHDIRHPFPARLDGPYEAIFNLAAVHRTPGHAPHEYYETNLGGALSVGEFAARNEVRAILFTSSIAVYGPGEDLKTEGSAPEPVSDYGRSKLLAEGVHRQWLAGDAARRLVIVRPAVIFGQGEGGNFTRLAAALRKGTFVYPGRKDTIKCCGYVGEIVRSMDHALALGRREFLYNFCYPQAYTIEEICRAFERVAGYRPPRGVLPQPLMNAAALPFEVANRFGLRNGIDRERILKLVRSTRVEPAALAQTGFRFSTDLDGSLRDWKSRGTGDVMV
ncbi:NAD(P)-dependent oxidoreductase [Aureimonas flava]|uniref:NAD(P)-dependent oxidoreductase n=1 Tax=Aureimonas flava TaxID=2320271 RepID=A0A3A1WQG7_9HYPH|nr:NAD(P)-dependent oxidoreductase [Aureimonas flava]RIY02594.1 NAD(P)-dependent oxidoreductase [Aureimonas flava]